MDDIEHFLELTSRARMVRYVMGQHLIAFEHIAAIADSAGTARQQLVVGNPVSALTPDSDARRYCDGKDPAPCAEVDLCFEYHKPEH